MQEKKEKAFKYGVPVRAEEMPQPRRLPQYDECLREFLESGHSNWQVDIAALPSHEARVVLSSLKWRTKNKREFSGIRVFMSKNRIYLERKKAK